MRLGADPHSACAPQSESLSLNCEHVVPMELSFVCDQFLWLLQNPTVSEHDPSW